MPSEPNGFFPIEFSNSQVVMIASLVPALEPTLMDETLRRLDIIG
jgi:hypothetical protein